MARDHLLAIAAAALSAICYLAVGTGSPIAIFVAYLSQMPLYAVALGLGASAAGTAVVAGAILVALAGGGLAAGGLFAISNAVPVMIIAYLALRQQPGPDGNPIWYPPGYILGWLATAGTIMLAIVILYMESTGVGVEARARAFFEPIFEQFFKQFEQGTTDQAQIDAAITSIARFLPAAATTSWLLMTIVNALLAQMLLVRTGRNLRPSGRFDDLEVQNWIPLAMIVLLLLAFLGGTLGSIGRNGILVMALPFFFVGLAVIHALSRRWSGRGFILFGVYFLLLVMTGWIATLVMILGLADRWISLRQRFAAPPRDEENE